jgi:uncharacterized membrane protein
MAHAQQTITIERPVQVVYEFILNGMNNPLWRPGVTDVERIAEGIFKQGLRGPTGLRLDGDYRIVDCQPGQRIAFEVTAGPVRPSGSYVFEAIGDQTRLTLSLDLPTKGLARLLDGAINRTLQAEATNLLNLKSYLEGQREWSYEYKFG